MKVYVVTADTYNAAYGTDISLFGIFTTQRKAEQRKSDLAKLGYDVDINETTIDKKCEIYLGGYIE